MRTKISFHPSRCLFASAIAVLSMTLPAFPDCVSPAFCSSKDIDAERMQVSYRRYPDSQQIDTLYRSDQKAALKREFDTTGVCFQGTVDSVIRYRTPSFEHDGDCLQYLADSVHVSIIARYKGNMPEGYWFIDTIITAYCDTTKEVWIEDGDPTYKKIQGDRFIAFMETIGSLHKAEIWSGVCGPKSGYYIDTKGNVSKSGIFYLKSADVYIESGCMWFDMTLEEFLDAMGVSTRVTRDPDRWDAARPFRLSRAEKGIAGVSLRDQTWSIAIFSLDGRLLRTKSVRCRTGERFPVDDGVRDGNGIRLVRISDGTVTETIRSGIR